jgi:hypothetical protein
LAVVTFAGPALRVVIVASGTPLEAASEAV